MALPHIDSKSGAEGGGRLPDQKRLLPSGVFTPDGGETSEFSCREAWGVGGQVIVNDSVIL